MAAWLYPTSIYLWWNWSNMNHESCNFFLTAFHHARYEIIIKHLCRQFFFESKELFCTFSFLTFFQVMFIICMTTYYVLCLCVHTLCREHTDKKFPLPFWSLERWSEGVLPLESFHIIQRVVISYVQILYDVLLNTLY